MTHYLLDTNRASAVLKRQVDLFTHPKRQPNDSFAIALPSLGELWFMVYNSARIRQNSDRLREVLDGFTIIPFDELAAMEFGRIASETRSVGRRIIGIDCQIAAIAHVNQLTLITVDRDFTPVTGLPIDNWIR